MTSNNVYLRVLGDNLLIKVTSKGTCDVWSRAAWLSQAWPECSSWMKCLRLSQSKLKICLHASAIGIRLWHFPLCARQARGTGVTMMNDSTEKNFLCVHSNNRDVCTVCVKPDSKEMISISLARCQEIFFFWKDRRGQGQVESTPLVFGIWCFWFGFSLVLV